MSDHLGPETDDLDAAFRNLVAGVETTTRAPGAERARRSATRRRTALAGGVLAAVVAVGAVIGVGVLPQPGHLEAPPAGSPSASGPGTAAPSDDVPAPARLTTQRLRAATVGWVAGWREGASTVLTDSPCTPENLQLPEPVGGGATEYRAGSRTGASLSRLRFASVADANQVVGALSKAGTDCADSTNLYFKDFSADLEVVGYGFADGGRSGMVWLVGSGDRVDLLVVAAPAQVPEETISRMAEALAADVQLP